MHSNTFSAAILGLLLLSGPGACNDNPQISYDNGGQAAVDGGSHSDGRTADGAPSDATGEAGAGDATAESGADQFSGPLSLRIMAANLTSGNGQSYDPGHGIRIMQALAPDVILIQEFNYDSDSSAAISGFVSDTFGPEFTHIRGVGSIPNGVISRWPILKSGEWNDPEAPNRDFAWARIDLPGPDDLWAVSVHFLASNKSERHKEANKLIEHLQQYVPAGALITLGGDFNTDSRSEGCVDVLRARFSIATPYPVDQEGNPNTNAGRNKPYDWVVVSPALETLEQPLVIGTHSFPRGLVFDSRVYQPLADVPPVLVDDSGAVQMQHMAVVRQFLLNIP